MKLTWHILRKDWLQLRGLVALWAALITVQFAIIALVSSVTLALPTEKVMALITLLVIIQILVGFLLAAALIQTDPLAGSRSFWITRPISGARLFGAKLLGLATLIWVVPVVAGLPWWLAFGFGSESLISAVEHTLLLTIISTLCALPLAVLTKDADRFVRWTLAVGLGLTALIIVLRARVGFGTENAVPRGLQDTRSLLLIYGLFATVAGVCVHQFLTRRTRRSIASAVVSVGAIIICFQWWPYDLSSWWRTKEPLHQVAAEAKAIDIHWRQAKWLPSARNIDGEIADEIYLEGELQGVPADCGVLVDYVTLTASDGRLLAGTVKPARTVWQYPDGRSEELAEFSQISGVKIWLQRTVGNALGLIVDEGPAPALGITLRLMGQRRVAVATAVGQVHANIQFSLYRCAVDLQLPLRRGARAAQRDVAVIITSCEMGLNGRPVISWVDRRPEGTSYAQSWKLYLYGQQEPIDYYCLVDHRRKILLDGGVFFPDQGVTFLTGVSLSVCNKVAVRAAEDDQGKGNVAVSADGFENVTLAKTRFTRLGEFIRTFDGPLLQVTRP